VALDSLRHRDGRLRQHEAHAEGHDVFVTSTGTGKAASLGGLDGADALASRWRRPRASVTARGARTSARKRLRLTIRSS